MRPVALLSVIALLLVVAAAAAYAGCNSGDSCKFVAPSCGNPCVGPRACPTTPVCPPVVSTAPCPTACPPAMGAGPVVTKSLAACPVPVTTKVISACPAPCPAPCPKPRPVICPAPVVQPICPPMGAGPCAPKCTVCPAAKPACPAPCPTACPAPCAPTCPVTQLSELPAQCPCPCPTPGAIGAGPGPELSGLACADFDSAYSGKLYNQNSTVIALTGEGIQRASDRNLRDISGEIRTRLTSENLKLRDWHERMSCDTIQVDLMKAQAVIDSLKAPMGQCFDVAYAQTLIGLLEQSRAAHVMAAESSALPEMRQQAEFVTRYTDNWIFRLQRWVNEKGQVAI